MAVVALILAALTWSGGVTAWSLLAMTAMLGAASAVSSPAWQTVVTDLVPREEVGRAVGLHGVSLSVLRALGPALGGALVWAGGPAAASVLKRMPVEVGAAKQPATRASFHAAKSVRPSRGARAKTKYAAHKSQGRQAAEAATVTAADPGSTALRWALQWESRGPRLALSVV